MTQTFSELSVRPTHADDIPDLCAVLDATDLFPSEMLADMLAPALAGVEDVLWLTCLKAGKPIGLVFSEPEALTDGTWNMRALAVQPSEQGTGAGAALVRHTEQALQAQGHRLLVVDTSGDAAFAGTRLFYQRVGYTEAARLKDFWAAGDDKVIFRKAL